MAQKWFIFAYFQAKKLPPKRPQNRPFSRFSPFKKCDPQGNPGRGSIWPKMTKIGLLTVRRSQVFGHFSVLSKNVRKIPRKSSWFQWKSSDFLRRKRRKFFNCLPTSPAQNCSAPSYRSDARDGFHETARASRRALATVDRYRRISTYGSHKSQKLWNFWRVRSVIPSKFPDWATGNFRP